MQPEIINHYCHIHIPNIISIPPYFIGWAEFDFSIAKEFFYQPEKNLLVLIKCERWIPYQDPVKERSYP
ncbi:hypothetical protein LBM341_02805 [Ralstonia solanacearum]|nr:hypothetical protein LBM341_02805 [Ralstonia solanacearum]